MKLSNRIVTIAAALLISGCSSVHDVHTVTLHCKESFKDGSFATHYSFTAGVLTPPVRDDQVDILYYYDADDCFHGSLMGNDDHGCHLFPIGHQPWSQLVKLSPPSQGSYTVEAIELTKDKEGLAFWVKGKGPQYVLVKIKSIQAATYNDLVSGDVAMMELEWSRFRMNRK
jgi:hypothetical protein